MALVFVTGWSDGLGRIAAQLLIEQGHKVMLHARNEARGKEALAAVPGAEGVLTAPRSTCPAEMENEERCVQEASERQINVIEREPVSPRWRAATPPHLNARVARIEKHPVLQEWRRKLATSRADHQARISGE